MASFRFSETFDKLLDELCNKLSRSKTAVIVDAVTAYSNGVLPDRELIARFDKLTGEIADLGKAQDELHTLCLQILKNQQEKSPPSQT